MNNELINFIREEADQSLIREAFWQASEYFAPLGALAQLWCALDKAKTQGERVEVAGNIMFIRETILSDDADGYSVLLEGFRQWVVKSSLRLTPGEMVEIMDAAIEAAENSAEHILDGDYWEMGIDELRALRSAIAQQA